jgi:cobalt/nickel transport system permease protein
VHAPDGFITAGTAVAAGGISIGTLGAAMRLSASRLQDRQIPLAGLAAAFVFAAQMINFPVAAGTTGHLIGGALVAILLGPATGAIVLAIVVVVQALLFADGGLTALGINLLNLAIVPTFGGYAAFRLFRALLPSNGRGVVGASGLAAGVSVVMSAAAFSVEWLFGASAPIPFDTVFGAMISVHGLIGIGEAALTSLVIASVLSSRPDLVFGADDLDVDASPAQSGVRMVLIITLLVTVLLAAIGSQFSATAPDGLERVAEDLGISGSAGSSWFSDYAVSGLSNESLSLALAGLVGVGVSLAVGLGLFLSVRKRAN